MYGIRLVVALISLASLVWAAARETIEESAVHTRELLAYRSKGVGVLMSTYPESTMLGGMAGLPFGLQEYYSLYPGGNGDILLLAMPISTIYRNAMPPNPPNMTFTVSDLEGFIKEDGNLAAGRMRTAYFGSLERVPEHEVAICEETYLRDHPDSRGWIDGRAHYSFWARLRVNKVFAFDGFGNVAYIGWIPLDLYRDAGAKMRSKKDCLKDWPEPEQPGELDGAAGSQLFAETLSEEVGLSSRLKIQL